ncbi:alpha-N-acetylgalactosamine-specific lectin-like [Saccostrea cucullata]|uniref:alpha-N-acetylgalactosamine-specific lectin-like n=1 Tax=Saccostrea cuccullata TaxID=36930 RepID=UPI002ED4E2A8
MAMSCITAMGLKTEDLFFSLGYEHYSKNGVDTIWIGATDNVIEGDWTWIESGDPLTFTDWGQGQPDNWSPDDDCTAMHKVLDFKWSDEDCNLYSFMYICEINNTNLPMVELG